MKRTTGVLIVLLLAVMPLRAAEIVRGRWEKVEALAAGTGILVKFNAGDRMEVAYLRLGEAEMYVRDVTGAEIKLPKSSVLSVETAEKVRDRLLNGALIGAGLGAAGGILSMVGFAKATTASGPIFDEEGAGFFAGAGIVGAGIGALAGTLIDASVKKREVLYLSR